MSWLGWGSSTNPQYEELVEKACSPLNLPYPQSEDISVNLEITDMIRSKAVLPKPAMQSLKRRIGSRNGRVQTYAFSLVDTCIKNGGDHFLAEIASKEFVDEVSGLIKSSITIPEIRQIALKYFQQWALAFQSKKELSFLVDVYNELKNSGIQFPPPPAPIPAHLLSTSTAPAWVDSDVCMRCRTAFTFTNRKHHCRNCGLVFDQACSNRVMPLPQFGITEPVRVCESCWTKNPKNKLPTGPAPAIPGRTPRSREDLDADLQRAIELSLAESRPGGSNFIGSEPPLTRKDAHRSVEDDDEELRLAIEASLREMEKARPSAPEGLGVEEVEYRPLPTFDLAPRETETILTFSNTLDQMAAYGERDLRRFPHAHVLYEQAYALGGKLQRNAEEKGTKQQMLQEMQAKLSEAVNVYGQILDGQQAYAARRLQEQQQRQYSQNMYAQQAYPQYGYDNRYAAPPQMNGYTPQAYPSQSAYQPPSAVPSSSTPAAPSLYPSMPNLQQQPQVYPAYQPQPSQPQQQQQYPATSQYRTGPESSTPVPSSHQQAYPSQAAYAAHPSYSAQQVQHAPPQNYPSQQHQQQQAQYAPSPAPEASSQHNQTQQQQQQQQPIQRQTSRSYSYNEQASAPPIDIASHPSNSPRSVRSGLPPLDRSTSYSSTATAPINTAPALSSPTPIQGDYSAIQQQIYPQQQQQYQDPETAQSQQAWQQQQSQPPQHQQYQPQHQQQQPPQHQQHLYSAASFPQAPPAAVFLPDAPSSEPQGLEKKEQQEALLIEL